MHVCEAALQHLRARKRTLKAILYVSGDGIRVVDQENSSRGLIVDQTIEKVSFCAPDRHNDKGFAYICREGATRRWMCHGFQATKESVSGLRVKRLFKITKQYTLAVSNYSACSPTKLNSKLTSKSIRF